MSAIADRSNLVVARIGAFLKIVTDIAHKESPYQLKIVSHANWKRALPVVSAPLGRHQVGWLVVPAK